MNMFKSAHAAAGDIVGVIAPPLGVRALVTDIPPFLTMVIITLVIVAGIFTLWQIISGGYDFITSGGDKTKIASAGQKSTTAITGLAVIAGSFIIISLAGWILFGNPGAFLHPIIRTL